VGGHRRRGISKRNGGSLYNRKKRITEGGGGGVVHLEGGKSDGKGGAGEKSVRVRVLRGEYEIQSETEGTHCLASVAKSNESTKGERGLLGGSKFNDARRRGVTNSGRKITQSVQRLRTADSNQRRLNNPAHAAELKQPLQNAKDGASRRWHGSKMTFTGQKERAVRAKAELSPGRHLLGGKGPNSTNHQARGRKRRKNIGNPSK